jgi:hypothetical protein
VPSEAQTLLVAAGWRSVRGRRDRLLVRPEFRRRFRGRVVIHDVEDAELVDLGVAGNVPMRVNRALVDTDAVVVVTAAETVVHGGPGALLAAAGRRRCVRQARGRCSRPRPRRAGRSSSQSSGRSRRACP